jgi:toxin YoeB
MAKYKVALTDQAKIHLNQWKKSGQKIVLKKIETIFIDLANNPFTGVGSPEPLKYQMTEYWSRKIDKKNRIIYSVNEEVVTVIVISARGHYGDK